MKKGMHLILLVCLTVSMMIILRPSHVYACSCAERLTVEAQLSRSDAVFAGRVLEVKNNRQSNGSMTKSARFEVSQTWKGSDDSQIIVHTGQGGGDCGIHFEEGQEYFVYAHPSTMYGDKELLVTIICDRTAKLSEANEDLAILGEGKAPTNQVDLEEEQNKDSALIVWLSITGVLLIGMIVWFVWLKRKKQ
ncbi:hypothetical protein BK133_02210 [Paenibacillus sp. FSL H8-0548]|uniref:hypothetical protein n=1 Tax=Paenibacillus sp. FSL H8-0548 TaxID=1920422 RepID=UPI00096FAC13|nr:hypothetical protein [Paenibacillus sp. FSL H8-0548]OMF38356.1 hypothetical protein BK133_02210 [Paenibacillus sp. FSL H8-0548]